MNKKIICHNKDGKEFVGCRRDSCCFDCEFRTNCNSVCDKVAKPRIYHPLMIGACRFAKEVDII